MAVIRAKRLWAAVLPAASLEDSLRELEPAPQAPLTAVYTVPPGKRAIIRTMTLATEYIGTPGSEPTTNVYIRSPSLGWILVWRYWWVRHENSLAEWQVTAAFNGQVVLHASDSIEISSNMATAQFAHGSGHELLELTS